MTGSRLAALLDQAELLREPHARLIALAPDLARLVIQAVERHPEDKWLLAQFAALDEKAGAA